MATGIQAAKTLRKVKGVGRKRGGKRDPKKRAFPSNHVGPDQSVGISVQREK